MDVRCTTCGEPWDVDYLRFEAIHETDLDPAEADAWCELSDKELKFNDRYRAKLLAAGWEFAGSVLNVVRCPCCPRDAQVDQERAGDQRPRSWISSATTKTALPPHLRIISSERRA